MLITSSVKRDRTRNSVTRFDKAVTSALLFGILLTQIGMATASTGFRNAEHGKKLAEGNAKFALDVYKLIAADSGSENIFYSPGSISFALAMTYLGARNKTASEMKETLSLTGLADPDLHAAFQDLSACLLETDGKYTLHLANRLFAEQSYEFLEDFLEKARTHYQAESASVDFIKKTEEARVLINEWVEKQTNSKIKNLMPSGSINLLTKLVLVNAIYFKGDWANKFNADRTKDGDFTLSSGAKIQVPMMYQKKKFMFGFHKDLGLQILELPYLGGKMSMFFVLPTQGTIDSVARALTPAHLVDPRKEFRLREVEVHVTIPKFKVEQTISMSEMLAVLGMKDLFSSGIADLSGLDGSRDLFVSIVMHKAFIEVNEEGSEAAAATGVVASARSLPKIAVFKADKPFVYFIRENATQTLLFLGAMRNPGRTSVRDEL